MYRLLEKVYLCLVTCHRSGRWRVRGSDGKANRHQCASELYNLDLGDNKKDQSEDEDEDIEASIQREIAGIKETKSERPFVSVKLDIECGQWSVLPFQRDYLTDGGR
jgi:hypothetical protein